VKIRPVVPPSLMWFPALPLEPSPSVPPGGLLPQARERAARPMNPNTHTLERTQSSFGSRQDATQRALTLGTENGRTSLDLSILGEREDFPRPARRV
jgi:hypothetical protein